MSEHRYILEKGSKKHVCPECDKRRFVRYIDTETGNYLPNHFGRCDRESKCAYHKNPYSEGYNKSDWKRDYPIGNKPLTKSKPKPPLAFVPIDVLKQTLSGYEENVFVQNLLHRIKYPFDATDVEKVISLYYLGTIQNGYRKEAITLPFADINGNIRAIQVKQFDKSNHTVRTDFIHSLVEKQSIKINSPIPEWVNSYKKNDLKVSCLFGEHLLNRYKNNPVALVEAPKTAIYGTLYYGFPENEENLLWLAVYNLSSLNFTKCQALVGRDIFLFPDLSKDGKAFKLWSNKAKEIESKLAGTKFIVSDLLEQFAPDEDKSKGNDIADYLIKQDWRLFREIEKPKQTEIAESKKNLTKLKIENLIKPDLQPLENWNDSIKELEKYFSETELPETPYRLNQCTVINNASQFVDSHLCTIRANNGNPSFAPYINRLKEFQQRLNTEVP